jgi:phosphoglycerate dehydrogenase-like enzyme
MTYKIGVSREFLNARGAFNWGDIGLGRIDAEPGLSWEMIPSAGIEAAASDLADYDALLILRQPIDEALLAALPRLRHVSRWGAGLDRIDLDACTRHQVLVTSTPLGGKRPVAAAAMTALLAAMHRLPQKDRLVREGRRGERAEHLGTGLTGKTLGILGLGHIGREFARLIAPFEARLVAYSPQARPQDAAALGVELIGLDALLASADAVVVTTSLRPETRGLLSAEKLALMKRSAFLVNVARGEIIDEAALAACLASGAIAGAALDVFHQEPLPVSSPLIGLDNVILAPHALAWTDEIIAGNAADAIGSLIEVHRRQRPRFVANPAVLAGDRFKELRA